MSRSPSKLVVGIPVWYTGTRRTLVQIVGYDEEYFAWGLDTYTCQETYIYMPGNILTNFL